MRSAEHGTTDVVFPASFEGQAATVNPPEGVVEVLPSAAAMANAVTGGFAAGAVHGSVVASNEPNAGDAVRARPEPSGTADAHRCSDEGLGHEGADGSMQHDATEPLALTTRPTSQDSGTAMARPQPGVDDLGANTATRDNLPQSLRFQYPADPADPLLTVRGASLDPTGLLLLANYVFVMPTLRRHTSLRSLRCQTLVALAYVQRKPCRRAWRGGTTRLLMLRYRLW